jgi:hypothetical protein
MALPDVSRPRRALVPTRTEHAVRVHCAEPRWLEQYGSEIGEPEPEGGLGGCRVVPCAHAADATTLLDVVRQRVAIVAGAALDVVLTLVAQPLLLKERCAHCVQSGTEACCGHGRILACARPARPLARPDVAWHRMAIVASPASDVVPRAVTAPLWLKQLGAQLGQSSPERRFSRSRIIAGADPTDSPALSG